MFIAEVGFAYGAVTNCLNGVGPTQSIAAKGVGSGLRGRGGQNQKHRSYSSSESIKLNGLGDTGHIVASVETFEGEFGSIEAITPDK